MSDVIEAAKVANEISQGFFKAAYFSEVLDNALVEATDKQKQEIEDRFAELESTINSIGGDVNQDIPTLLSMDIDPALKEELARKFIDMADSTVGVFLRASIGTDSEQHYGPIKLSAGTVAMGKPSILQPEYGNKFEALGAKNLRAFCKHGL